MDYNEDVLIYSHDWRKKYIAGNVYKENFLDILTGKRMINVRNLYLMQIVVFLDTMFVMFID